jgi:RimJ/RimL family protein N-acetyltransferase
VDALHPTPAPPHLTTERFVLTPFDPERDWPEFVTDIVLDPVVTEHWMDFRDATLTDVDRARLAADEFIPWFAEGARQGFVVWTVRDPEAAFVGVSGLMTSEPPVGGPDPEFGCLFGTRWHGRGVATEVGHAVIADAWARLDMDRIITVMDSPNRASRRLVDKLGFTFEGPVFDAEATPYLVFVLDRPDRARQPPA